MEKNNLHVRIPQRKPQKCTYCGKHISDAIEFYPHESGGYCIFMPRYKTDYACDNCAYKKCEVCNVIQIRYAFIECDKCGIVHCYNNTDMVYRNNLFLKNVKLCDAMNRDCDIHNDDDNDDIYNDDDNDDN
jgi:hypothetical protein